MVLATIRYLDINFIRLCYVWTLSIFAPAFVASVLVAYGEVSYQIIYYMMNNNA